METVQNKEAYEAPRAEISIISNIDIITASPSGKTDENQGKWDWDF